ncbi:MAG: ribokinase [Angelakisella sp.]|nr:ribokinase [Angelakisella sp.]
MKLLNFGSLNLDYVYQVEHFVRPGETLSSNSRQIFCGGKGLNQSIALARAGAEVYHAGAVGEEDGEILCKELLKNRVNIKHISKNPDVVTGHAIIQIDKTGQNCILLYGGANQTITIEQIDNTLACFENGDYILLQNEISNLQYIVKKAHDKGMIIVLNPSPLNNEILALPLEYIDYFILNEIEAADLCGEEEQDKLIGSLVKKFPASKFMLTLGKKGVRYWDGEQLFSHGIYRVPVVDTTAAGDTFTGYFISSIVQGHSSQEALRLASVASSIAVSRKGASSSIPMLEEVKNSNLILDA